MKTALLTLIISISFMLCGCEYEAPLAEEQGISIDPKVIGLWKGESELNEQMMILKYTETEYLIHYPVGALEGSYYRGYPINVGGIPCVQLEMIGAGEGPLGQDEMGRFNVVSYRMEAGKLEIKLLNTSMVDEGLTEINTMQKAFLEHKDAEDLFHDPGVFVLISN